jgi:glycosyltransferase involved in cell wall biosynthesis
MRILVHDYGGYAFPLDLSRQLARTGHRVHHLFFRDLSTARGNIAPRSADPPTLRLLEVRAHPYDKYRFWTKPFHDRAYGRRVGDIIRRVRPDVVLSADTPLDAQAVLSRACKSCAVPFVYWLQDIISIGIHTVVGARAPVLGPMLGRWYRHLEQRLLRTSASVIAATPDFLPFLAKCGVPMERSHCVENWCPLADVAPLPADNAWARQNGLAGKQCVLYSGTLGLKHNPRILVDLSLALAHRRDAVVVIVAEGPGAVWLANEVEQRQIRNLMVLPLQPYENLSEVLASASVLLAISGPEASRFCFPSKVMTYLCAGRPVLAAAPVGSYICRVLKESGAGLTVEPDDVLELARHAGYLLDDRRAREDMAENGLAYARMRFDIEAIASRFLAILVRHARPAP